MDVMVKERNLDKLVVAVHTNAVEHGMYECPVCKGADVRCPTCKGTNEDSTKNLDEILVGISKELVGEALDAWQHDRRAVDDKALLENKLNSDDEFFLYYSASVHNTFEDELADVFIRLFDLAGYMRFRAPKLNLHYYSTKLPGNVQAAIGYVHHYLPRSFRIVSPRGDESLDGFYTIMMKFCADRKISIWKYIDAKIRYNTLREYRHGKVRAS